MNVGHVEGGTRAGWRRVRPPHRPWPCGCADEKDPAGVKVQPGYRGSCDDCGRRRPSR